MRYFKTNRMRKLTAGLAVPFMFALTACSGSETPDQEAGPAAAIEAQQAPTTAPAADEQVSDAGIGDVAQDDTALPEAAPSINADVKKSASKAKHTLQPPTEFPYDTPVKVESSVTPPCVKHGERIDISITTPPEAAIAYQAIYADNKSGAGAPFGEGYGGNDKGYADDSGHWQSSWIVAPNAPAGRARVDVYVGFEGKWGTAHTRFAVADSDGNCPQEWLKGEG